MNYKNLFLLASVMVVLAPAVQAFSMEMEAPQAKAMEVKTMTDEQLVSSIRDAIRSDKDPILAAHADKVDIKADKGVVTLSGKIHNAKVKSDLELKVKALPGVDKVVNNIEVLNLPEPVKTS